MSRFLLEGKVVWITGASRGIGRSIALSCAVEGARTILVARQLNHLEETSRLICDAGGIEPILCDYDITSQASVGKAFNQVFKQVRQLDVLVNNAGVMHDALIGMVSAEQIEQTFSVNVFAALYHIQYASRLMARGGNGGSIINISSIMGRFGNSGQSVYCASKAALIGVTKSCAKEMASQQIRVNAIAPGFINTDLIGRLTQNQLQHQSSMVGMGRIGDPDDVARSVLFLGSDLSKYVTGQIIGVDGGMIV